MAIGDRRGLPGRKPHNADCLMSFPYSAIVVKEVAGPTELRTIQEFLESQPLEAWREMRKSQPDGKRLHLPLDWGWTEPGEGVQLKPPQAAFQKVLKEVIVKADLPTDLVKPKEEGPRRFERYVVVNVGSLKTLPGAKAQIRHQDVAAHKWSPSEQKGKILSGIMPINKKRILHFFDDSGKEFDVAVEPGQVLLFLSDHCHQGTANKEDEENLAVHFFLNPSLDEKLGDALAGCLVKRQRLSLNDLNDPRSKKFRLRTAEAGHVKAEKCLIAQSHNCQLCHAVGIINPKTKVVNTGRRGERGAGLERCILCNVTLCSSICFEYFHKGVGLPNSSSRNPPRTCRAWAHHPTIKEFKKAKAIALEEAESGSRGQKKAAPVTEVYPA